MIIYPVLFLAFVVGVNVMLVGGVAMIRASRKYRWPVAACPRCGYDLRGSTRGCSECGADERMLRHHAARRQQTLAAFGVLFVAVGSVADIVVVGGILMIGLDAAARAG